MMILLGGMGLIYLAIVWFHESIGDRPLLVYSAALLGVGTQLVTMGILAELVTSYSIRASDTFSIAERVSTTRDPSPPPSSQP